MLSAEHAPMLQSAELLRQGDKGAYCSFRCSFCFRSSCKAQKNTTVVASPTNNKKMINAIVLTF